MKRYNMRDVTPYVTVHPDGEWVRYSDHVEAMKRIANQSGAAAEMVASQSAEPVAKAGPDDVDDVWPIVNITVSEDGEVTEAKLYAPGLPPGNHDVYPVRVPYMDEHTEAWMAVSKALEQVAPGYLDGSGNGIECAVKAIHRLAAPAASPAALTDAIKAMRKPKAPDGAAYAEYDKGYNKALSHVLERLSASHPKENDNG